MLTCGIDPGVTGALAFIEPGKKRPQLHGIVPMPIIPAVLNRNKKVIERAEYDWPALAATLADMKPDRVIVERQWARPREGVTVSFRLGFGYGGILGVIGALGLPFELVTPLAWKNAFGLRGHEKEASRELAIRLLPEGAALFARKKDHGRAEAALIALWKVTHEDDRNDC